MRTIKQGIFDKTPSLQKGWTAQISWDRALIVIYMLFCFISVLPFLLIKYPPITDFANHAAGLWIACSVDNPVVSAMYEYRFGIIPDLAADAVNLPLCGLVAPDLVLKLIIAASLALIYASGWYLQRTLFGRPNCFLLMLPALAFNAVTTTGYVNYLAGIGLAFVLIAGVLAMRARGWKTFAFCNIGGLLIFFCHIFALAFAMAAVFGVMLQQASLSVRGFIAASLRTLAAFALPLLLVPFVPSEHKPFEFDYGGKVRAIFATFLGYNDVPVAIALIVLALVLLAIRRNRALIDEAFRWPLVIVGLFVLVIPGSIRTAVDVDSRTMVAATYLFFMALRPAIPDWRVPTGTATLSAALIGLNLWTVATIWLPFDRQIAEFRGALGVLPPHAKVLSVESDPHPERAPFAIAYWHLASYATIDRQIFNPLEFDGIGMQPLNTRPAFSAVDTPSFSPLPPSFAMQLARPTAAVEQKGIKLGAGFALRWPQRFDYVIYYHFQENPNFSPADLTLVRDGSFFSILKVKQHPRSGGETSARTNYRRSPNGPGGREDHTLSRRTTP